MKKIYLLLLGGMLLSAIQGAAQTGCNVGNESPIFTGAMTLPPNMFFAAKFTATNGGTLTAISMESNSIPNMNVKMAVYDDNAGMPGNLIASTAAVAVTGGTLTVPVSPVSIVPGDYHVGAIIDISGSPIATDMNNNLNVYAYSMNFSNSFPATGSGFSVLSGRPVNIWMNVTCLSSGITENENFFSVKPVQDPLAGFCTLNIFSGKSHDLRIGVYAVDGALCGNFQYAATAGENQYPVPLTNMPAGVYLIRIESEDGSVSECIKLVRE